MASVGLFLLTSWFALNLARNSSYRLFFAGVVIAAFYVAMEEISWGQQVFSWSSPEYFEANNLQGETNLHNMFTGPFSTELKAALGYAIAAVLWGYGVVYRPLLRAGNILARTAQQAGIAPPPFVWPYFLFAGIFELGVLNFNEAEIGELLVGAGLLMPVLSYRYAYKEQPAASHGAEPPWPSIKRVPSA